MPEIRNGWSKVDTVAKALTPVVVFVLGMIFTRQQHAADEDLKIREQVASLVKSLGSSQREEKQAAIWMLKDLQKRHPDAVPDQLLAAAVPALVEVAANDRSSQVSQQAQQLVQEIAPPVAKQVETSAAATPARVFVHFQEIAQEKLALAVQKRLQEAGLRAPGIEQVKNGPSGPELRYFHPEDKVRTGPILDALRGLPDVQNFQPKLSGGYATVVRPNTFEIWFGPGPPNTTVRALEESVPGRRPGGGN